MSPSRAYREHPYKRRRVWPLGYNYRYRQLRDVPISQLSEEQFNYVVKSILYAAMGRYKKRSRSKRRGNS